MYSKRLLTITLLACCALLVMGSTALAASVTTDTTDYPRGSTVYITGTGFWAGEQVRMQVVHADGDPLDGEGHDPWYVVADGAGSFSSTWVVPFDDNLGETLLLTADGLSSGLAASVLFTDNVGTNLDQLQNGTATKTPEWANGNINSQNSCYSEGDGVPFRYFLTGVASGEKYRFTIQSEWTKGGINAYDYFVQYDITEAAALAFVGDVCGTISTAVPSDCSPTLGAWPFPDPTDAGNYVVGPPSAFGALPSGFFPFGFPVDAPANLKAYGAVVDSMGPYFFTGTASDLELNLYVYVTITQTGSAGFFWAGHLAEGTPAAWGIGAGAASVGGAPYHMRAIDVKTMVNNVPTGSGAKNQDRSIQNGTICLPPDATITCASSSLSCTNLQSSCSAAAGAGSYEWAVIGGTIDAGQGTNTVTYTATSDTVYIYLTACSSAGACPDDFCCNQDSVWIPVDLDTTPPIIQCPADIALGCNPPSIPDCDPGSVQASDPCGTPSVTCTQIGADVVNGCMYTRTYRYYVSDAAGNVDSCDQLITWTVDTQKPVFSVCPPSQDLGCNPQSIPTAAAGDATATDNCGTPSVSVVQGTASNNGCVWTRTDVWTATDGCGNTETCSRTLTWTVDTQKPVFSVCPPSQDLGCNPASIPNATAGMATATDNCGTPAITVSQGTPTANGCVYTRIDTWTATDICGNTETCTRTLTWTQDTQKPVFSVCPPSQDLGCNPASIPNATAGMATATDNCGTPSVSVVQGTASNNGCVWTRTDVWTATDGCGNTETCSRTLTWTVDTQKPVFSVCPPSQDLGCNPTVPDASAGDASATDNCGAPAITVVQGTPSANGCVYTRIDTWTATDICGNTETCSRTLTWTVDTQKPVFSVCPPSQDLGCNPTVPDASAGDASATDNCGAPAITVVQGTPSANGCVYTRIDTWTATDVCGNTETCSRTLTWTQDNENPAFTVCPSDQDLGCNPSVIPPALPGDATATDNCGVPTVTVVEGTPVIDGCHYTRTDTWTATDICGNTETCTRTLTWITDANGPSFTVCPSDEDLGCNPTVPPASESEVTANNGCGQVTIVLVQGTPQQDGCAWSRTDVWTATDICGNTATCTRTYTWTVDTEAPVFTLCPPNQDLGCNPTVPDADPFEATATDNCGTTGMVVYQGTPTNVGCVWTRTDVFEAVDHCGNSATCSRTFTWTQDTEKPVFTVCPPDQNLGCNPGNIPPALIGDATATDNCGTPTVTVQEGTPTNDGCAYSRTDVWTATDGCGNIETCSRTLTWAQDTENPVFSVCPPDQDLGCDPTTIPGASAGDATATDDCGTPSVTVAQGSPESDGCVFTRTDTWTATDVCGNQATCSRTLTWKINTAPVVSCPNDTMLFLCDVNESLCLGPFTYTDPDCNEQISESVSMGVLQDGQVCLTIDEVGVYEIEYVVTDGCGASDTCRTTVYVSQPQIVIDTLSTLQNTTVDVCIRVNGMSFPWGGFDFLINYDPIVLSFVEALPGEFIVDCGWEYFTFRLVPSSTGLVRLIAIADMNNSNKHPSCRTPDSGAVIACLRFKVTNDRTLACQATPLRFWWDDCGDNAISDTTGNVLYIAGDLPMTVVDATGNDYTGFPNIGGPPLPCPSDKFVSVPCIEYRIGKVRLVCPGEIDDRGDLNLNGLAYEISDAVLYSRYFIEGAGVLNMGTPPGEAQIAASDINVDGQPLTVADLVYLIRVITGDVAPVPDDFIGGSKLASTVGSVSVLTTDQGRTLTVGTVSDQELGAAQFVFSYKHTNVTRVSLLERAKGMSLDFRAQNGELRVLVYNIQDRARIAAGLGDILEVETTGGGSVELVSVEAATFMGGALDVQLAGKAVMPEKFALHQNFPNPFNPSTSFAIDFPTATDYTLTVYNVTGQIVRTFTGHAPAGTTTITWQGNDNAGASVASGVYFYRLKAGEFEAIRKMVLMK